MLRVGPVLMKNLGKFDTHRMGNTEIILLPLLLLSLFAKLCLPTWPTDTFEFYGNKILEKETTKDRRGLWVKSGNKLLDATGTA